MSTVKTLLHKLLRNKKALAVVAVILAFCLSFGMGYYTRGQSESKEESQRCRNQLLFAAARAEDLKKEYDPDVMETMISHVYDAYSDSYAADIDGLPGALHELWNALIFDGEQIAGREEALSDALKTMDAASIKSIAMDMRKAGPAGK